MYLGSTFRTTTGARICGGAAPGTGSRSANHTSQLPEKLVTLGICIAMLYTTRPPNLGSRAPTCHTPAPPPAFGAPPLIPPAAAPKFSSHVGEKICARLA